ncbi:hypothetical protein BSG1_10513 [Bacillus sp. SG-1]|nr:hypothetical protein BSG1_10513 [Bacillus sp. SG-1]
MKWCLDMVEYEKKNRPGRSVGLTWWNLKRRESTRSKCWFDVVESKEENRPGRSVGLTWWNLKRRKSTRSKCWFDMVESEKKRIGRVEVVLRHGGIRKEENQSGPRVASDGRFSKEENQHSQRSISKTLNSKTSCGLPKAK